MKKFVSIMIAAMMVLGLMIPIMSSAESTEGLDIMYVASRKGRMLNIRELPSKNSRILYRVGSGKELKILHDEECPEGWARVQRGNKAVGYAMTEFLKAKKGPVSYNVKENLADFKAVEAYTAKALPRGQKTILSVGLRTEPTKQSAAIRRLTAGDKLEVIEVGNTWSKVIDSRTGKTGYVANNYIAKV